MNKEVKEILDRLKDSATNQIINVPVMGGVSEPIDNSQCLEPNECKTLLDYITNLQEENEKLKQPQIFIDTMDMEERYGQELYEDYLKEQLENYKSRIDKAIEYIEIQEDYFTGYPLLHRQKLLDIIKGEDK